jgi:hypothetical protein
MIHCKNCIYWIDESLEQIEVDRGDHSHIFMGCRIRGNIDQNHALPNCKYYVVSQNLFTICQSCKLTVPKVCVSLGECANCTDTDLFCVDSCLGDDSRKYCTHFVRLHTEGIHLIDEGRVFELYPTLGMPGPRKPPDSKAPLNHRNKAEASKTLESQTGNPRLKTTLKPAKKNSRSRINFNPAKTTKRQP